MQSKTDSEERHQREAKVAAIQNNNSLSPKAKRNRIARLPENPESITRVSYFWAWPGVQVHELAIDPFVDLAIGKLEPFDPAWVPLYPTFKDPSKPMPFATSLCRLGFPFHHIKSTCDPDTGNFTLEPGSLPVPIFPIEGIYTRELILQRGQRSAHFLETSSPGLRGQSGGPIFDVNGTIWAVQTSTAHLPLGFSPKIRVGKKEYEEQQFLNVGVGSHVREIVRGFSKNKVNFQLADY